MTKPDAVAVLNLIDKLFPRSKWDEAERQCFGRGLLAMDLERAQAEAVIDQYRRTCRYATPNMAQLTERLEEVSHRERIARKAAAYAQGTQREESPLEIVPTEVTRRVYERYLSDPAAFKADHAARYGTRHGEVWAAFLAYGERWGLIGPDHRAGAVG